MTQIIKHAALALSVVPVALVWGQAAATTETVVFSVRTTNTEETKELPGNPCTINQELTKVAISSQARGFGDYNVTNTSNTSPSETVVRQGLTELSIKVPGLPGGDALIDATAGPFQTNVTLSSGESEVVDPSFDDTFNQPPPVREFTDDTELAFFDSDFDVVFKATANDGCDFTTGNSICTINTFVEGQATVEYTCTDLEPALQCDTKTLSPAVLSDADGVVSAAFTIRNTGDVDFLDSLEITDTMNPKMLLNAGTVTPLGDPAGGPPVYTWSNLSLAEGEVLDVTYQATITGLDVGETVCNDVVATADSTSSNVCSACVTRAQTVPAIGPFGIVVLGGALAGLGMLFGFRRRV